MLAVSRLHASNTFKSVLETFLCTQVLNKLSPLTEPKCSTPCSRETAIGPYPEIYRMSRGECARLRENVPYVKVYRSNPKHLYPKLNGYGDNGERKVWSSCGYTYCTCFACCYPYTAHVRPSVSQPSQAHSAFIINRCHSYSEL